jgi:hypothetical protein
MGLWPVASRGTASPFDVAVVCSADREEVRERVGVAAGRHGDAVVDFEAAVAGAEVRVYAAAVSFACGGAGALPASGAGDSP